MRAARLTCSLLAVCLSACATAEDIGEDVIPFVDGAAPAGPDAGIDPLGSGGTPSVGSGGTLPLGNGGAAVSSGGTQSAGGAAAAGGGTSSGGAPSAGGTSASGGTPGGGSPAGGAGTCGANEKTCNGACTVKTPGNGCDAADCKACPAAPANGYGKCTPTGGCDFDCLLGFQRTADGTGCQTQGGGPGGGGSSGGTCVESNCPICIGVACCKSATECGCKFLGFLNCG